MKDFLKKNSALIIANNKDKLLIGGFILVGIIAIGSDLFRSKVEVAGTQERPLTADTMIPFGFVLVPIEIQNQEALASLTNGFAIVDLFTTAAPDQKSGKLVGRRLRLIQAPLNPQAYAVLVPESETAKILAATGPFVVAIQNRQLPGMGEMTKKQAPSRITYYQGGGQ